MAAFVSSMIILVLGVAICMYVGARRPLGTPLTWGEAFVAGTFVFGLMLLAYGIVPHQWLTYADNELLWRPDKLLLGISSDGVSLGQRRQEPRRHRAGSSSTTRRSATSSPPCSTSSSSAVRCTCGPSGRSGDRKKPGDVAEARSRFGRPVLRKA